jgi:multidrug efflux pump subunit AcrA (membrane-fusion protein)
MKEKINTLVQNIRSRRPLLWIILAALILLFAGGGVTAFSLVNKRRPAKETAQAPVKKISVVDADPLVAVVGIDDSIATESTSLNNSWPGEIISSELSQIQPQREGVIADWRIRIGDTVSAGEILGSISAPPATPELIAMLAEKAEALARARAQADVADTFAVKEQLRLDALSNSLTNSTLASTSLSFAALENMRTMVDVERANVRSFIEQTLTRHVLLVRNNITDWRANYLGRLNAHYGVLSPNTQNTYEMAFLTLVEELKGSADTLPIASAQKYFEIAVRLANYSQSSEDTSVDEFKMNAPMDQSEFLKMLGDYRKAQADLSDKETEYKIMISENGAMVEKDRSMAHADVAAMQASYNAVANEIIGRSSIVAPRAGVISAIYKKVGDLVDPAMSIALVAGRGSSGYIVRIRVPNNIRRPAVGEVLSVMRPGFAMDMRKITITGVGISLDITGSYMADAVFIDPVDWPAESSVRVISPQNSNAPVIKLSSVWWDEAGTPHVWGVSGAGRIFARKIIIGRTLGTLIEIYEGLTNGDRYIISPTKDIGENVLLEDITPKHNNTDQPGTSNGGDSMGGMEM